MSKKRIVKDEINTDKIVQIKVWITTWNEERNDKMATENQSKIRFKSNKTIFNRINEWNKAR